MARMSDTPTLTANNRIYLYQLLSRELGRGKQTFLPAVEKALASDRMTADDLGFESTRALLEALEEFVKLTVFKGGRIYATVISQPAWDEALAAAEKNAAAGKGGNDKPWKRKKADKSVKPVRPKRVKRPEPEPAVEPELVAETVAETEVAEEPQAELDTTSAPAPAADPEPELEAAAEPAVEPDAAADPVPSTEIPAAPEPAISLTVVYDPYNGVDRETTIQSHPVAPKPVQKAPEPPVEPIAPAEAVTAAPAEPAPEEPTPIAVAPAQPAEPVTAAQPEAPKALSPELLATYPVDFATEVYLASERIAELCELLPYGTDVFTLLAEDYTRARTLELIEGTRARVTFPLRILHVGNIDPILVTLKKRSGTSLSWEIATVA